MNECCFIQQHLRNLQSRRSGSHDISRLFDHLMSEGKVNMALRLLAKDSKVGVLSDMELQDPPGLMLMHGAECVLLLVMPASGC